MSEETTEGCADPHCGHWVRVALPLPVSVIARIATAMPEGTMWVYGEPQKPGAPFKLKDPPPVVWPDYANLHTPHGWYDDGSDPIDLGVLHQLDNDQREPVATAIEGAADSIGANAPRVAQLLNDLAALAARDR